jgi:hypothetical protein
MQQPRAERMDGLHLEAARRLQCRREQPPGMGAQTRVDAPCPDITQGAVERHIVERGPPGKRIEHALRHVGGRRLGEGEAQDAPRLAAIEQKPDHPLRQHVGLAGAGIGRDPGGHQRIGRSGLNVQHFGRDNAVLVHAGLTKIGPRSSAVASASPPVADHSFTRAR